MACATLPNSRVYQFVAVGRCNMCGAGGERQAFYGRRLDRRQGFFPRRLPGVAVSVFRCRECGLVYPDPMPIPGSIEQHYDLAPERYWHESYFRPEPGYMAGHVATFETLTGRSPRGRTALDIGAGIGKGMIALGEAGFDAQGFEPSPSFRDAAIERMGIAEDRLQLASIESAEFPADAFDFINFSAVLEHLADPDAALRKTVGWLKPGGVMYVEVPSSDFLLSRLVRSFYRVTGSNFVINVSPMHVPYHLYEFGLRSFREHAGRAGYSVALHDYLPYTAHIPKPLVGPLNALMKRTGTGLQLIVWLRKDG